MASHSARTLHWLIFSAEFHSVWAQLSASNFILAYLQDSTAYSLNVTIYILKGKGIQKFTTNSCTLQLNNRLRRKFHCSIHQSLFCYLILTASFLRSPMSQLFALLKVSFRLADTPNGTNARVPILKCWSLVSRLPPLARGQFLVLSSSNLSPIVETCNEQKRLHTCVLN